MPAAAPAAAAPVAAEEAPIEVRCWVLTRGLTLTFPSAGEAEGENYLQRQARII
jgi:hypothetical protein